VFVITADQIDSTHRADLAGDAVTRLNKDYHPALVLPVDRNAGDEIQAMLDDPAAALALILELTRSEQWSVGCGIGEVRSPLPANTREAAGPSFVAARQAVDRAKRSPTRFALRVDASQAIGETDIAPILDLLLFIRSRRTDEGWELYDLLSAGLTQSEAADRLGISPQAASQRARAGGIRTELTAHSAVARLFGEANTRRG
jgi:hypothetical protein